MALSILSKKTSIKNVLKLIFSGLSISFSVMLVIMLAHDTLIGAFPKQQNVLNMDLVSPACW
ncbi:MAG TPA: hypothetical protein VFK40_04105 [Nitrososphaeraceae archaeon]|nr:hypothetical protein [Nitrososphaeraceae archaeon]